MRSFYYSLWGRWWNFTTWSFWGECCRLLWWSLLRVRWLSRPARRCWWTSCTSLGEHWWNYLHRIRTRSTATWYCTMGIGLPGGRGWVMMSMWTYELLGMKQRTMLSCQTRCRCLDSQVQPYWGCYCWMDHTRVRALSTGSHISRNGYWKRHWYCHCSQMSIWSYRAMRKWTPNLNTIRYVHRLSLSSMCGVGAR